jgi:excisionase family DNA binding protein
MEKQTVSVAEAAEILGLGRNTGYDAVRRGEIPVIKIGKRLLVPKPALDRLLQGPNG